MTDFNVLSFICGGRCWDAPFVPFPDEVDENHKPASEQVKELLLCRMLFSLIDGGCTPEQARNELTDLIDTLSRQREDPHRRIDFEIIFHLPQSPKDSEQPTLRLV